jgi:glycogen debranching enzyme
MMAETPIQAAAGEVLDGDLLQFYISASASLSQLGIQALKQGDTFAVFNPYGDILSWKESPEGLFHNDTRHLSRLDLTLNGYAPLLLSSNIQDDNAILSADLTNPDLYDGAQLILAKDTVHVLRSKFLWQGACYERIAIRNFSEKTERISLRLAFEADFADLFEVRGHSRAGRGTQRAERRADDTVVLLYEGLDGVARETVLRFDPTPDALTLDDARFDFEIEPEGRRTLFVTVSCAGAEAAMTPRPSFFTCMRAARRVQRAAVRDTATVETSNTAFNELLCRSFSDLCMLLSPTEHGLYPYAGIPWFSAPFGRDGIITALQMLWADPSIAKGVLRFLAATQATELDPAADAEPGKILHEARNGEMARLGEVPFRRYYGSVDATPLFVLLAGLYFERTGDVETVSALWPNIEAALKWIDGFGDPDGDGFVEYHRQNADGLLNQGWKDSPDSVFHADGQMAVGPIALCEVQGYVYAAKRTAASMARSIGKAATAATLDMQANVLREKFDAQFWCEELSTYALALDGEKRPCRVRSSNAGHALFAGLPSPEKAARVSRVLTGRDGFSGWGVRTLARTEPRYNPMSYHNGSVWPHDNAIIAFGLARYGMKDEVSQILRGLFESSTYFQHRRLPELFCGFVRRRHQGPINYPVACSPQAWASATPFAMLQACLGLEFNYQADEIIFNAPRLPEFLDQVCIRGLTLGDSRVDVLLRRHDSDVAVNVLARTGTARVVGYS